MQIPFTKIPKPESLIPVVSEVLRSGQFVAGKRVEKFEARWAEMCHVNYCAAVSSGSAAIELALRATLPPGSTVIVPALSFAASAMAVVAAGMQCVFVDVETDGLLDWRAVDDCCDTAGLLYDAILPVFLYGQAVLQPHITADGVVVIGDMAQAHGLTAKGCDAACFSFYPSKNLGACGEAGAVVSDDKYLIDRVQRMSDYGRPRGDKHGHQGYGSNLRMDELQAAILLHKLPFLDEWNRSRIWMAERYREAGIASFTFSGGNVNHLYPVRVTNPTLVQQRMREAGVETGIHYPYTLPELFGGGERGNRYPHAEAIAHGHITLPMGPGYSQDEIYAVVEAFRHATQ